MHTTTRGNTTTFSNDKGQITGRAERRGNTTNFYNDKGQIVGTPQRDRAPIPERTTGMGNANSDRDHAPARRKRTAR
jgi:hypothetical protein